MSVKEKAIKPVCTYIFALQGQRFCALKFSSRVFSAMDLENIVGSRNLCKKSFLITDRLANWNNAIWNIFLHVSKVGHKNFGEALQYIFLGKGLFGTFSARVLKKREGSRLGWKRQFTPPTIAVLEVLYIYKIVKDPSRGGRVGRCGGGACVV